MKRWTVVLVVFGLMLTGCAKPAEEPIEEMLRREISRSLSEGVPRMAEVARRLAMNWGVTPIRYDAGDDDEAKLVYALQEARRMGFVSAGDTVVVTSGYQQTTGGTDLIRVVTVEG